ncbi:MAG: hypothetical protein M1833_006450 [Piccolia ochrophora]|nr:MAG: hypothetical protein M1833_006450 [Piccolia ochrophora]
MYARGILFGKMKYELGDHSFVRCPENNLVADLEFKTKGYFSGGYNVISGAIKNEKTQEVLYELSGMWSGEMYIKDALSAHKELLFDATHAKETPPSVRPLEDQGGRESQKLWHTVTEALKERNHDLATDDKSRIEDMQRAEAAKRAEEGVEWRPRFFRPVQGGPDGPDEGEEDLDWILNAKIDGDTPEAQVKQITSITPIVTGSQPDHQFDIPSWKEDGQPTPAQAPAEHQSQHAQQPPQPQQPQHPQQSQQPQQPSAPPQSNGNDLIDFSDDSAPAQAPPSKSSQPPNDISQAQVSSDPGLQQPLQPQNQSVTNAPPASITAPKVMRLDTDGDVDEFVDADDGLLH